MIQRIYAPERLKYPLKRVGRRGEGRFERISWSQALDEIAGRLKDTIDKHTNESVMIMHGSGNQALVNSSAATYRFFNLIGGSLAWYSDYSTACIQHAWHTFMEVLIMAEHEVKPMVKAPIFLK